MKREIMFFCKICDRYDSMAWLEAMDQICRKCIKKSKSYTKKQLKELHVKIKIKNAREKIIFLKNPAKYLKDHG